MTRFNPRDPLAMSGGGPPQLDVGGLVEAAAAVAEMLCPRDYVVSLHPEDDGMRIEVYLRHPNGEVLREWSVATLLKAPDPLAQICDGLARAHVDALRRAG